MAIKQQTDNYQLIGKSPSLLEILDLIEKAADANSTVIVNGESGTGKEMIARALHHNSQRKKYSFIPVNCAAIPSELMESELFGHEKGAFTGAMNTRRGRFELADKGTLFLDEIGDLTLPLQVKLLRVLAENEIDRVGGNQSIKIDVRIIAATHKNLEKLIEEGGFREDLYYRLNVIPISLPPLRERKPDISILANYFLQNINLEKNKSILGIDDRTMDILNNYPWPGNIRELANFIERMVVLSGGPTLMPSDLPAKVLEDVPEEKWAPLPDQTPNESPAEYLRQNNKRSFLGGLPAEGINLKKTVEDFEKELILEALAKTNWVKNKAAVLLGLNRTTLVEKLKKMKIRQEDHT
jgi:transcriptional regulator with GAF, ATPase, and Fis domain